MLEICILYCLIKREMTIYSVRKFITELFGAYTKPSHGAIHPALKKLETLGCVSVQESLSEGGKKSSYYSITEKGRMHFVEIMLSDFSENPAVSLNEINIRIAAMGALSSDNRILLKDKCIKFTELYTVQNERILKDEYSGLDKFQKAIIEETIKNIKSLINFLIKNEL